MTINFSDKKTPPKDSLVHIRDVETSDLIDQELILKLDSIKTSGDLYKEYSEIYFGGIYALNEKNRIENPDWMSQSANSFREIFYILQRNETKELKKILGEYLKKSLTKKEVEKYKEYLNNLYDLFSDLTHHFSNITNLNEQIYRVNESLEIKASELNQNKYFEVIRIYKEYLKLLVITAIETHQKIDKYIKEGKKSKELVKIFLNNSHDSKIYFFSKVDENWLHWLWTRGFLVALKKKANDPAQYSHSMPELGYLTRMAEKEPDKVAKIINSVKISKDNFNPEVIARFLWIISALPAEQIKTLTKKIRVERWGYLMRDFNKSGYEFIKIVEKLAEKKEFDALLELAQAIFDVRVKKEISKKSRSFNTDNFFYIHDINASNIFEVLVNIDENYTEKVLKIVSDTISKIIKLSNNNKGDTFDFEDPFNLFDVDFFTLKVESGRNVTDREDIKNLMAVIKKMIKKAIKANCSDKVKAKKLFKYIDKIPLCRSMWRLRLFVLSLCPEVFKNELRDAFFRLFREKHYYEIISGTEYEKTLHKGFSVLNKSDKHEYIKKVIEYFVKKDNEKENKKENWHLKYGSRILSVIINQLTKTQKQTAKKAGFELNSQYKPEPSVGKMRGGMVHHQSPHDLNNFTIEQIIENLKDKWKPEKLNEQFKNDDFLSPRGAEGLGDALKEDIKKRTSEYLEKISEFFDRDNIDPNYLYSLMRGIEEMFRNNNDFNEKQIEQILGLFNLIELSGKEEKFKGKEDKTWLADWITVHKVITDILLYISEDKVNRKVIHKKHRDEIKDLISYLFTIEESPNKKDENPEYGDLHHVAINSVRGRAFEIFVVFAENDGKTLTKDTKEIYKEILRDDSLAVRFMVGRYLASFYFRDKEFITSLLTDIFPKDDPDKKDIYLAAWEGYLTNTLYDKLFVVLRSYYSYAITLNLKNYTQRKYSKGLDESLAIHLGLAFIHFGLEIKDPLFEQFWDIPNITRQREFISFIGHRCLIQDWSGDKWMKDNKVSKKKLIKFWDWALEKVSESEPEILSGFGSWINPNSVVLDDKIVVEKIAKTLEKSGGDIDWDYGLLKRLSIFAEIDKDNTIKIIKNYLLDKDDNLNQNRRVPFMHEGEIQNSLKTIYNNGSEKNKQDIINLINILIEKGSSTFWSLKGVVE